ncbi:MAG TPA: glycoside hydrolase family 3 C-terminal domain-containing protein, partial [Clostridia bacterium]
KGDDPFYYKALPSDKHFYAYNQEAGRESFSVTIDDRNRYEYYIKPFKYTISSGAVKSMMTSYNMINGIPNTANPEINNLVKAKWATDFFVVTDMGGPFNLVNTQHYYPDIPKALAGAIKAGVDSMTQDEANPSKTLTNIKSALSQGLLTEADIDKAVKNIIRVRFHLGDFDPAANNPYSSLGTSEICAADHSSLSAQAARESVVLLKNNNILPLTKSSSVAVIGSMANTIYTDWYSGTLPYKVTPLDGIKKKAGSVIYAADNNNNAAVNAAKASKTAIVFVGNDPCCGHLGWAVPRYPSEGMEAIDRKSITLEPSDQDLIKAVYAANPNTIVVLVSSFPYALNWENQNIPGIVYSSHGGQEEGNAIADVLFGDYAPAGRLNSTWYSSLDQIPPITDYDIIKGKRTYMYFDGTPLYPFGYGLSYTTFSYDNIKLSKNSIGTQDKVTVSVDVTNTGSVSSDEVVQMYVKDVKSSVTRPKKELKGFKRINLAAGESKTVSFDLPASELAFWYATKNDYYVEPGDFDIMIGRSSEDIKLTKTFSVTDGSTNTVVYGDLSGD